MNIGEEIRRATLRRLLEKFVLEHLELDIKSDEDTARAVLTLKRRRSILERAGFVTQAEAWHKILAEAFRDTDGELEVTEVVAVDDWNSAVAADPASYPDPAGELEATAEAEHVHDWADATSHNDGDRKRYVCQASPACYGQRLELPDGTVKEWSARDAATRREIERQAERQAEREADPDPADELDLEELA